MIPTAAAAWYHQTFDDPGLLRTQANQSKKLSHLYHHNMISRRPIGHRPLFVTCLHGPRTIGHTRLKCILPRQQRCPLPGPEHPAILRERRLKRRLVPGDATINTHLHLLHSACAGESQAANFYGMTKREMTTRTIDAVHGVQRAIVPALVGVETAHEMIGQLDSRQPLGILFAIATRDENTQRETMPVGERN